MEYDHRNSNIEVTIYSTEKIEAGMYKLRVTTKGPMEEQGLN